MVDHLKALVAILQADAALSALVSTRVFGGELPRDETASMPRKAVELKYSGGGFGPGSSSYVETTEFRVDVKYYGETPFEADKVRRAGHDAFKAIKRKAQGDALIHRAVHSGGPINLRDPDTDWPYVFESWNVLAGDPAIV